ncbi:MAG: T9SS type A sorting domain-containing protein, partial [Chitinophagaceae bacterium]
ASGIRCFITTTQPRDNFSEAERVKLKELRDLIVQRFGPYTIDFWTDVTVPVNLMNPLYNLGDKIHLTPEAHTLLKNRVVNSNIFFSALAVSQLMLHAQQHHGAILLDWSTTTEVNSHHFEVQKSADGIHFTQLSNIAAAGNSSGLRRYSFEDTHPTGGCSYYRVMAVDNTGQKDFSNNISIVFTPASFNVGQVYANPVRNQINIRLESDRREQLSILVLDATGKQLLSEKVILTSSMVYNKDVSRFSAGTYRIVVDNGSTSISRSFTKQ